MNKNRPPVPPEDIPEEVRREMTEEATPPSAPEVSGEEVSTPSVPLTEDFNPERVTKITRLAPDHSQRDAIREEERQRAAGRKARVDLSQARPYVPGTTSGHKGRGSRTQDN